MNAEALAERALAQGDSDIEAFVERHGRDGLVDAADYAFEYVDGNVDHRIMAREREISPLEAAIILEPSPPSLTGSDGRIESIGNRKLVQTASPIELEKRDVDRDISLRVTHDEK